MFNNGRGFLLAFLVFTVIATVIIPEPVAAQVGCYKGYCWSWCGDRKSGSWCYTTKGRQNDEHWVGCSSPAECNENWQCANTCHPKDYKG
ncbi:Allergen Tha p 2, partial [Pseudolycoriella hygida]